MQSNLVTMSNSGTIRFVCYNRGSLCRMQFQKYGNTSNALAISEIPILPSRKNGSHANQANELWRDVQTENQKILLWHAKIPLDKYCSTYREDNDN